MRITIRRIGAVSAGAFLALALVAGSPAEASDGLETKTEKAGTPARATCLTTDGKTQGRSPSDPDGTSNGGPDKPGCPGGLDADRDGNNGCGNDADREDDNNGRCGNGPKGRTTTTDTATVTDVESAVTAASRDTSAGGTEISVTTSGTTDPAVAVAGAEASGADPASAEAGTTAPETPTEVLGQTLERGPDTLARTGAGVGGMALLGGLLCGGGRIALLARRLLRIG